MMESSVEGDVVVVTGAGSGIGRATAVAFAARGAHVVATDRDLDAVTETAQSCAPTGTCVPRLLDVTNAAEWSRVLDDVTDSYGPIRVLVNNAGYTTAGRFLDHSDEDWSALVAVNVRGVVTGARLAAQHMIAEGTAGQIINIASGASYTPITIGSPYCTTKAAVLMFSEALRIELKPRRIGVTAICPGAIDTGFYTAAQHVGDDRDRAGERRDLSAGLATRLGTGPETVAAAIMRSVTTDRAVQPVTAESYLGYVTSRLSPTVMKTVARLSGDGILKRIERTSVPHRLRGWTTTSKELR